MDLVDQANKTAFFGREFLAWLWFRSELQDGLFRPSWGEAFELWFDDVLQLEVAIEKAREVVCVRSESPTEADAAKAALRAGQKPTIAKLRLIREAREWIFTLHSDLTLHGAKVPAMPAIRDDIEEAVIERLFTLAEAEAVIDGLFADFLALRCNVELWPVELEGMRAWVQGIDGFTAVDTGRIERLDVRGTAPTWIGAGAGARRELDEAAENIERTGKLLALDDIKKMPQAFAEYEHLDSENRDECLAALARHAKEHGQGEFGEARALAVIRVLRALSDLAHSVRDGTVDPEIAKRMRTDHLAEVVKRKAEVMREAESAP